MPQPIDTAPKDGTRILGLDRSGWREMWFKRSDIYEGESWRDHFDSKPEPTHWVPIPAGNGIVDRDNYTTAEEETSAYCDASMFLYCAALQSLTLPSGFGAAITTAMNKFQVDE